MTSEERELMNCICQQIQCEKDPKRFAELVQELEGLLSKKEERLAASRDQR